MKSRILGLLAAVLLAGPMSANAVVVNVGGEQWNITTVTGSVGSLQGILDDQVWWNEFDSNSVVPFLDALGGSLGYMNNLGSNNYAPFFAASTTFWYAQRDNGVNFSINFGPNVPTNTFTFAVASRIVPEPGTLALLGLGLAGLGLSRRRRAN